VPADRIKPGSIGPAAEYNEMRLDPVTSEILVRGPNVFMGYLNLPEKTAETIDADGWLHTGDVGVVDEEGFFRITDRMKDIIITAGGKNITPSELENELKFSPYVTDAVVIGDKRPYLTVIIMIDQENVEKYAQDNDVPFSNYASLTHSAEVQELIQAEVDRVNKKFARVEQIKKFWLLDTQLSAEDEELTPTMKLKRKLVEKNTRPKSRRCTVDSIPSSLLSITTTGDLQHETQTQPRRRCDGPDRWRGHGPNARRVQNEITLGSIQDLSGPLAGFGKQVRLGMMLRVDEANEQGGINGRKFKLLVEDSAYDPRRAVLAAQKLVNQDKIFAMIGHIGTAQNMAAMPVQFQKNVINFFPVTAAREMYEPFHKLKYSFAATYYDQMRLGVPILVKEKNAKQICAMHQDDEFGLEVFRGAEAGLKSMGMQFAEVTTYKRGATDFASQMQKLASSKCDFVVMGTIIRETIGGIATARRLGFQPHIPGFERVLHRPDPQVGWPRHEWLLRHHVDPAPLSGRGRTAHPFLGQQVQDQVQRRPDRVLGLRLQRDRFVLARG
jgi:ABC-type branched-subunit amino acid transport system substrate-binding protein